MNPSGIPARRLNHLDGLRGIAAFWVMLYHYSENYGRCFGHPRDLGWTVPFGNYAFLLFFMISGFVILMTIDRIGTVGQFAWARCIRLYPVYWISLFITFSAVTLSGMLPERQVTPTEAAINLTMLQGFLVVPNVDGVYWTLQIELCFYLVMGLIVASGMRPKLPWFVFFLLVLSALKFFTPAFDSIPSLWRLVLIPYFPWFAIGIAAYELRRHVCWQYTLLLLLSTAIVVLSRPLSERPIAALVMGGFFLAVTGVGRWLASRPLVFCGTISYSLYLIHGCIGYVLIRSGYRLGIDGNISIVAAIALSIALACGLTFFVERPVHSWLRNFRGVLH